MRRVLIRADGAARGNPGPASAGAVLIDLDGASPYDPDAPPVAAIARPLGRRTNNWAEWTAVVLALERAAELGAQEVELVLDSKLVVEQLVGRWRVKEPSLAPLHARAKDLLRSLRAWTVRHEGRASNRAADALANLALDDPAAARAAEARSGEAPDGSLDPDDRPEGKGMRRLERVWVNCRDLASSASFYELSLGLRREFATEGLVALRMGEGPGVQLLLAEALEVRPSRDVGITLEVDSIDVTVARLRGTGCQIVQEPQDQPGGVREASVLDPDGHQVWLVEHHGVA